MQCIFALVNIEEVIARLPDAWKGGTCRPEVWTRGVGRSWSANVRCPNLMTEHQL